MKKFSTIILVILLFGILISIVIFFFYGRIRDYFYREISYQFIANQVVGKEKNEEKIALLLFEYIHEYLNVLGEEVIDKTSWDDLIRGIAWCDQQSWALATLLSKKNIHARITMLIDKDGVSPHTITEVLLNEKWRVFDPLYGLIFRKPNNNSLATLEEISNDFSLFAENPKVKALPKIKREEFLSNFKRMFPLSASPKRWSSLLTKKNNIFLKRFVNRLIDSFVKLSPKFFIYGYQDLYLFINSKIFDSSEEELYYSARNHHLYGRINTAEKIYRAIIKAYPQSKKCEDSQFFLGVLYEQIRDYKSAIDEFNRLFERYPDTKWAKIAHYFLGKAYELTGNLENAKINYNYSKFDLYTDAAWRLSKLSP
jgi:hypothetical protein